MGKISGAGFEPGESH